VLYIISKPASTIYTYIGGINALLYLLVNNCLDVRFAREYLNKRAERVDLFSRAWTGNKKENFKYITTVQYRENGCYP
jgi:hypothetical protein